MALVEEGPNGQLVSAVTEAARIAGARPGMRLTDARALDPGLVAVAADGAGDRALVERLARWASRWSPLVEVDGADSLRLDTSGVAHLFGGEAALVRDIEARFATLELTARVAVAATAGAAWGLARYQPFSPRGRGREARSAGRERGQAEETLPSPRSASLSRPLPQGGEGLVEALAPLPVAALRLPPDVVRTLERLGLKTIGALVGVPRRSLARRFREADNPLDALDRMLGRKPEPLTAAPIEPPARAMLRLAEPVADPSAAAQALVLLVPDLVRQLEARRLGARRLVLAGYRVDGEVQVAAAACAIATRDPSHLTRLLKDKTDTLDPGFGFDAFALEASWAEPLDSGQDGLVDGPPPALEVARLVDRLSVKLGPDKVRRPVPRASHVPERASGWGAAVAEDRPTPRSAGAESPSPASGRGKRPQRLLDNPEAIGVIYATPEGLPRRFVWRRLVHDVVRAEGPERISPEWWRERGTARLRDYYRVEDRDGRRYWIYREGLFGDGRGGDPLWYLHGLFG